MAEQIVSNTYNFSHHQSQALTPNFIIHSHSCYELYYFVSGDLSYLYDGTEITPAPHSLMIISPSTLHGIHVLSSRTYDRYTFHFTDSFFPEDHRDRFVHLLPSLNTVRDKSSPIPFFVEHADRFSAQQTLDEILALRNRDEVSQEFFAPILLESLLSRLYLGSSSNEHFLPSGIVQDPPELAPVLDYIRRHLSERITLDSLAEKFYLSRSQLNHLFRKHFNTSVMNYVSMQRLSYAQKLLTSGMSASEVASTVGCSDYSTFYRSYTKHFGHPPKDDLGNSNVFPGTGGSDWVDLFPWAETAQRAPAARKPALSVFPDIGFENNAYDPLE